MEESHFLVHTLPYLLPFLDISHYSFIPSSVKSRLEDLCGSLSQRLSLHSHFMLVLHAHKVCIIRSIGVIISCSNLVLDPSSIYNFQHYLCTSDNRHFATDVIGGIILAAFVTLPVWKFYDNMMKRNYRLYQHKYIIPENSSISGEVSNPGEHSIHVRVPSIHSLEMKQSVHV